MADQVTELSQAFPVAPPAASSAGVSDSTAIPLGSTKQNFWGKEAGPLKAMAESNKEIVGSVKEEGENQINRSQLNQERQEELAGKIEVQPDGSTKIVGGLLPAQLTELQTLKDRHQAEVNKELERIRPIIDAADKYKFHEYWSDAGTGRAIMAAIASGLLGFGTGQYHNVAMELAEADHKKQVAEFNALLDRARLAGQGVEQLMKIQEQGMTAMTIMQAAKYKAIAAKYDELGAQATTVEQQTAARMGRAIAEKKVASEMETLLQGVRTHAGKTVSRSISKPTGQRPGD